MTQYREILRLNSMNISGRKIAETLHCSRNTVAKTLEAAKKHNISWPLSKEQTDSVLEKLFYSRGKINLSNKRMPDFEYVRKELKKNGVSKKLLWIEYLEQCRISGDEPFKYSQFCHYILQDEIKHRATMHINRKPGEQIEVDWAGDPAYIIDLATGEKIKAYVFVGLLNYSLYTYAEAFINQKENSWIDAHVHMYEYFGGVSKILVPDNCKTAVLHNTGFNKQELNKTYSEMAEHYGTAIIPARVRTPKDKASVEGAVGNISTYIIAALRNQEFFSLEELNAAIWKKLDEFNRLPFQKKEGSRYDLFRQEEQPLLLALPPTRFEMATWKQATVQYNYHIFCDGMLYSVPYEFLKRKVEVRLTAKLVEIFYKQRRIAVHTRLYGRRNQYSTTVEHMPQEHQQFLTWNGDRFRDWAKKYGPSTAGVIEHILTSKKVEQQTYRSCMSILRLADKYSAQQLEAVCLKIVDAHVTPSYKVIKDLITVGAKTDSKPSPSTPPSKPLGIVRGADFYRR